MVGGSTQLRMYPASEVVVAIIETHGPISKGRPLRPTLIQNAVSEKRIREMGALPPHSGQVHTFIDRTYTSFGHAALKPSTPFS